jgi:hypothetical protein
MLANVLDLLRGDKEIVPVKRVIDFSANPVLPEGHSIVRHVKQGKIEWAKVSFRALHPLDVGVLSEDLPRFRTSSELIDSRRMVPKYLKWLRMPNIILRDYLIKYPHLMSSVMYSGRYLFWGTVLKNSEGMTYVPGMMYICGRWQVSNRVVEPLDEKRCQAYDDPFLVF